MTPEQLKAIAAMKITRDSAMTIMQAQGITLGGAQPGNGNGNPPPQGALPAGTPPDGQPPRAGQPPSGGPPPSGGQQPGNGPTGWRRHDPAGNV